MSNSPRRATPRIKSPPDFKLRVFGALNNSWMHNEGAKFRGAGLASAVRALRKKGYVVEKVPA